MGIFSKKNKSEDSMPENTEKDNLLDSTPPRRSTRLPIPQTNLPTSGISAETDSLSQSSDSAFSGQNRSELEDTDTNTDPVFGSSAFADNEEDIESVFNNVVDEEDSSDGLNDRLSSPDTLEQRAAGETLDEEIAMPDEEELLSNSETSVLKRDKEPVLEILTPSIATPIARSRREMRLMSANSANSSDNDEETVNEEGSAGEQSKKAKRSLFGKSKRADNTSEEGKEKKTKRGRKNKKDDTSSKNLDKNLLNPVDEDGDESEEAEKKKKKSLREMTLSDLLPSKKDKTEAKLPLGENILIDLMPQSHKTVVEVRQAKKTWTGVFGAVVIGCLVGSGLALGYNWQTQQKVQKEQVVQEDLDLKIAQHAEVNQALQSESAARDLLSTAAGNEIDWNDLITTIESNLPAGTRISSLAVVNGGTVEDEVSSAVTMNLTSDTTLGYSDALRSVEGINGVQKVDIGGLSMGGENQYVYAMSFTFDTSILTERFSIIEEEPVVDDSAALDPELEELLNQNGGLPGLDPLEPEPVDEEFDFEDPALDDPMLEDPAADTAETETMENGG